MNPRFIMLGGFLGAGKTTTIARLARYFSGQGLRVAIVTNDQTTDLVDTHSLRSQGFDVGEVAGACFCCNFNELTSTVERLGSEAMPDVYLAEPVGSCTDLVATVIRPLQQVYGRPIDLAPYGVLLKPSHGAKILAREANAGFSPQAEYIFRKQLEEADFIVLNRVDQLSSAEVDRLADLIESEFPGRPLIRMSARTGQGFERLCELLDEPATGDQRTMDLDYDVYAAGEAELGWLNSQVVVQAARPFALDQLLVDLVERLQQRLVAASAEAAHVKVIGLCEGAYAVANVVSNDTRAELSLGSGAETNSANVVVNARVATSPEALESIVRQEVAAACEKIGAACEIETLQSFRPGRPVPTHRLNT